jgi:prepilin signal peptidase PulO-like enzyme (type II secretory pathway)
LIGSFLNVVAIRLPKGESIAYPPSHCVHCGHQLRPADLIPVLSYVLLRGRCRYCRSRISPAYPAGELAASAAFALMAWRTGCSLELIGAFLLAGVLIAASHTDLREMVIPDKLVAFGIAAGIAARLLSHPLPWWDYALGAAAGSGIMLLLAVVSRGGMGGGDIKLYLFVGLMLGLKLTILSIFAASVLGSLYGLGLMLAGKFQRRMHIPFGPFIALGAMLSYSFGESWLAVYLALFQ